MKEILRQYLHRDSNYICGIGGMLHTFKVRLQKGGTIAIEDVEYVQNLLKLLQENKDDLYKTVKELENN